MRLLHFEVESQAGDSVRGVSVWVDADDPDVARLSAETALAAAGWFIRLLETNETTTADDYFRPCPSQQAFARAQTAGVAWRFDDE